MSILASLTLLCFLSTFFCTRYPILLQVHADIDNVNMVVKNVPDYAAEKEKNDMDFLTLYLEVR